VLSVGFQDRPFRVMPEATRKAALERALVLRAAAERIAVPLLLTEVDPRAQGRTLALLSHDTAFDHRLLSAWSSEALRERLAALSARDLILFGIETHIGVAHTAEDLLAAGYRVHVVVDACLARREQDADRALARLDRLGVWITTVDAVIYSLIDDTRDPAYHDLSRAPR
jgi:hypothetical protein